MYYILFACWYLLSLLPIVVGATRKICQNQ